MINCALDWDNERTVIKSRILALPVNPDLHKMLRNIDSMVAALSIAETKLRTRNKVPTQELEKVNSAISTLEQWLIMATLMR